MSEAKQIIPEILDQLGLFEERDLFEADYVLAEKRARVEILVMGEFNHGKSSLINMLSGRKVLKVGLTPTTQVETTIGFGAAHDQVTVYEKDGTRREVPLEELQNDTMANCSHVAIELCDGRLSRETLLIDTPGLNEAHALRETFVETLVERASLILFLLDASQPATRNEIAQVDKFLSGLPAYKRAIVVNKCDRLDEDELSEVRGYVEKTLYPTFCGEQIHFVSAKKEGYAGNEVLLKRIEDVVNARKASVAHEAIARVVDSWCDRLRAFTWLFRALGAVTPFEMPKTGLFVRSDAPSKPEMRLSAILSTFEALQQKCEEDLSKFEAEFQKAMVREIDKALIDDVEDYLEGFVISEYRAYASEKRSDFAYRVSQALIRALGHVDPASENMVLQKLMQTIRLAHVDRLLATELAEKQYVSNLLDELSLERLVKLPGVYKYRVEVVRKRANGLIHDFYVSLLSAFKQDIERYKRYLKRVCLMDAVDSFSVVTGLLARSTTRETVDDDVIDIKLDELEQLR